MTPATPHVVESLEARRCFAADPVHTLGFAFALGPAVAGDVATDPAGNVYVAGGFTGTVDFNPSRRKTFALTSVTAGELFVAKYSPEGGLFWAIRAGGSDAGAGLTSGRNSAVAVDGAGRVYVGGGFRGTVDFDSSAGVTNLTSTTTLISDGFVLGLDGDGAFRFATRIATPGTPALGNVLGGTTSDLGLDAAGHVYALASSSYDPGGQSAGQAIKVTRLTATGRTLWSHAFGDATFGASITGFMAVAPSGEAYLGGQNGTGLIFDPDPASPFHTVESGGSYLMKLTPDGEIEWLEGTRHMFTSELATDAAGNLYAAGGYTGTVDFNLSSRRTFALTTAGNRDAFVAKYSARGALDWVKGMGGGGPDGVTGVAVAPDGRVHVTGWFVGRASFNPGLSRFRLTSVTEADSFFATFTPAGVFLNAQQIAPNTSALAVSRTGALFATGSLLEAGDADPTAGVFDIAPVVDGQSNLFVLKLN